MRPGIKGEGREGVQRGAVTKTSYWGAAGEGESQALLPGRRYAFYAGYHHRHQEALMGDCLVFRLQSLRDTICSPFVAGVI